MERFMISVAMRVGLINVSALPRPNFLAIDEGFGVADSEHIQNISLMFDYLKEIFEFILVITHNDHLKDSVDKLIDIHKTPSGYSLIQAG